MANYVEATSGTGDVQLLTGHAFLLGLSARESASSAAVATFILRDGTSTAGPAICYVELSADQCINGDFGEIGGIEFKTGLYLDRIAGETSVTVYV